MENIAVVVLTYNRGKLLEKNILQYIDLLGNVSLYVLDNHSLPENSYFGVEEICSCHDNLHYYRHSVNLQFHGNLIRGFEIPKEDYIVLLSDEDFLCPGWYEDFHQIVSKYPNLLAARPSILGESGESFYGRWDSHIFLPREGIAIFGIEGNYISGQLYNRKRIISLGILDRLKVNLKKNLAYPHLYLNVLSASHGICAFSDVPWVRMGPSQVVESDDGICHHDPTDYGGALGFGARLDQMIGLRDALIEAYGGEVTSENATEFYTAYVALCNKYARLIIQVNGPNYHRNSLNLQRLSRAFLDFCMAAIENLPGNTELFEKVEEIILREVEARMVRI